MKTLNLFFNSSEKDFTRKCAERQICTKTVMKGHGCRHCTGPFTYQWIETDRPNYDLYISYLENGELLDVFFYNEVDRAEFLEELSKKISFNTINIFHSSCYYQMKSLYGVNLNSME